MASKKRLMCQQPDVDEGGLRCGYPLPCPRHTVVIDKADVQVPIGLLKSRKESSDADS